VTLIVALCAAGAPAFASASGGSGGNSGGGTPVPPTSGSSGGSDAEVAGEILVKLRTTAALGPLLQKYPLTLTGRFGARPIYRLKVVGTTRVKDILPSLSLEPDVMIAEVNITNTSPEARRNLPWAVGTAAVFTTQWAPAALRLPEAQRVSTGAGVRVAVLDTGVDATHPALAGRLLPGFDFVDYDSDPSEGGTSADIAYGHGTHVAGLVAMVAPGAQILPVRVLDANGMGNAWVLAEALLYAVDPDGNPDTDDGAQVINLSLGSFTRTRLLDAIGQIAACDAAVSDDPLADRSDPGYTADAVRCSKTRGAVVVAAAGNDASSSVKEYPAGEGAHGLLAVTASTSKQRLAAFGNFGPWVDMAAPGEGITSTVPGGWGTWSGTSMAAPLAAGTAALLRSANPSMTPVDVVTRIKRASAMLCGTSLRQVDAAAALTNVVPPALSCR
jgi:subtilisin family serine protease